VSRGQDGDKGFVEGFYASGRFDHVEAYEIQVQRSDPQRLVMACRLKSGFQ
jgi:hypothetical protein